MKKAILLIAALAVVFALAACGKKEETNNNAAPASGAAAGKELKIVATNWKFDQPEYKVKKGETVKLTLESKEGAHAIKIDKLNVEVGTNKSKEVTFNEAGTYDIICSIPCGTGHANMKAKLVVE